MPVSPPRRMVGEATLRRVTWALALRGPSTVAEVAAAVEKHPVRVSEALGVLQTRGVVVGRGDGVAHRPVRWALVDPGTLPLAPALGRAATPQD